MRFFGIGNVCFEEEQKRVRTELLPFHGEGRVVSAISLPWQTVQEYGPQQNQAWYKVQEYQRCLQEHPYGLLNFIQLTGRDLGVPLPYQLGKVQIVFNGCFDGFILRYKDVSPGEIKECPHSWWYAVHYTREDLEAFGRHYQEQLLGSMCAYRRAGVEIFLITPETYGILPAWDQEYLARFVTEFCQDRILGSVQLALAMHNYSLMSQLVGSFKVHYPISLLGLARHRGAGMHISTRENPLPNLEDLQRARRHLSVFRPP